MPLSPTRPTNRVPGPTAIPGEHAAEHNAVAAIVNGIYTRTIAAARTTAFTVAQSNQAETIPVSVSAAVVVTVPVLTGGTVIELVQTGSAGFSLAASGVTFVPAFPPAVAAPGAAIRLTWMTATQVAAVAVGGSDAAPAAPAVLLADSFTGSNGAAWSGSWAAGLGSGASIQGNAGRLQSAGSGGYTGYNGGYNAGYSRTTRRAAIAAVTDFDMRWRFKFDATANTAKLLYRSVRDDLEGDTCFGVTFSRTDQAVKFYRALDYVDTDLASTPVAFTVDTWYWLRVRVVGTSHQVRVWADGAAEPTTWGIDASHVSVTAGYMGFSSAGGSAAAPTYAFVDDVTISTGADTVSASTAISDLRATVAALPASVNGKTGSAITLTAEDLDDGATKKLLTVAERTKIADAVGKDTLTVLAPRATGADQTAALQAAVTSASTYGLWLALNGNHVISDALLIPTGGRVDGTRGTLTQTANLKAAFRLTAASGVKIRDVKAIGKTTDYVNDATVYAARAVYVEGASSDIEISGCEFTGWAGAGVYLSATCSGVRMRRNTMTGAGATYILGITYNYSGGIVTETGATAWVAEDNDISGFAQGIVTGDNMANVAMINNYIHDIPGQHGIYCETVKSAIISHNLIRNTALLGMKIQIGTTTSNDADTVVVSNNCFSNLGAQGILLTNPVGGTPRIRRVLVTDNIISIAAGKGIEANNCVGLNIADNIVYDAVQGVSLNNCSEFTVTRNRISKCTQNGVTITDCQDWDVSFNRIKDPGSLDNASAEFGIAVAGSTTSDGTLRGNKITDSAAKMRYAVYVSAGDLTSIDIIDNQGSGATDYGYRGLATNARTFRGNVFAGTSGAILTGPSNYTAIADTSGAALATLETEVNKLKALVRTAGLMP